MSIVKKSRVFQIEWHVPNDSDSRSPEIPIEGDKVCCAGIKRVTRHVDHTLFFASKSSRVCLLNISEVFYTTDQSERRIKMKQMTSEGSISVFCHHMIDVRFPLVLNFWVSYSESVVDYCFRMRDAQLEKNLWESVEKRQYTDVDFHVDSSILSAHKVVVSARSPVLAAMLKEDSISGISTLNVDNVTFSAFDDFLYFLYTGRLSITSSVEDVLRLATRYQVSTLIKVCKNSVNDAMAKEITALIETLMDPKTSAATVDDLKIKNRRISSDLREPPRRAIQNRISSSCKETKPDCLITSKPTPFTPVMHKEKGTSLPGNRSGVEGSKFLLPSAKIPPFSINNSRNDVQKRLRDFSTNSNEKIENNPNKFSTQPTSPIESPKSNRHKYVQMLGNRTMNKEEPRDFSAIDEKIENNANKVSMFLTETSSPIESPKSKRLKYLEATQRTMSNKEPKDSSAIDEKIEDKPNKVSRFSMQPPSPIESPKSKRLKYLQMLEAKNRTPLAEETIPISNKKCAVPKEKITKSVQTSPTVKESPIIIETLVSQPPPSPLVHIYKIKPSSRPLFSEHPPSLTDQLSGTNVKFSPFLIESTKMRNGTRSAIENQHQCISMMPEYLDQSMEELRSDDYMNYRILWLKQEFYGLPAVPLMVDKMN